ncbi:MAG TPA: matrixin family metalloprotease, partial [Burkholderiales bacterium]|nr:matrixin family metalloprotease [Burkholderiales bacterium]
MPSPTGYGSWFSYTVGQSTTAINALTKGYAWGSGGGTGATLTYSFPGAQSYWDDFYSANGANEPGNYDVLTSVQQTGFINALQQWANVGKLTFTPSIDTDDTVGDIRVAYSYNLTSGAYAWAYYPGSAPGGDVWLNANYSTLLNSSFTPGSYEFMTLVHELGHALGLQHSFGTAYALSSA